MFSDVNFNLEQSERQFLFPKYHISQAAYFDTKKQLVETGKNCSR